MKRTAAFGALLVAIAAGGLALRLPQLGRRVVHTDEAVHAYKLNELLTTGRYVYDPTEYHGPTLYYCTLPVTWLSGARDWRALTPAVCRIVPVLFGAGLILLLLLVADGLGRGAALAAGVLTAVSPAMSFYSRYYIQETLLVFFTFLVVGAGWRYARSGRTAWLLLAGAGLGLMQATKETCVIAWGAMLAALAATALWTRRRQRTENPRRGRTGVIVGALVVAAAVSVTLLSGFFANLQGPVDAWRTYATYLNRASGGIHIHPWWYYFRTLLWTHYPPAPAWSEALVAALALVGLAAVLARRTPAACGKLPVFLAFYALFMTAAYAVIPYKTPWCLLGFWHGLVVLAGTGVVALIHLAGGGFARLSVVLVLLIAGTAHLGAQGWRANLRFCDDARNPYAYAQSLGDVLNLAGYVERLAAVQPVDRPLVTHVIVPNCWPLPWYLRHWDYVGYWETVPPEPDADIVIASHALEAGLRQRLRGDYDDARYYGLRRDETLVMFVSRPLRTAFERSVQSPPR